MDVDQELTILEDGIRRLKIEYEIFFNGGAKRLPYDLRWRVESLIKKYSDFGKMTFAQRFRYNTLVAKFQSYSDLWRRMVKSKEEGRPHLFPDLVSHSHSHMRIKSCMTLSHRPR